MARRFKLQLSEEGDERSRLRRSSHFGGSQSLALYLFALVLLAAGGLKAYAAAVEPYGAGTIFHRAREWTIPIVEWAVASWIIWGAAPLLARRASIILLLIFVGVSSTHALRGDTDCGCFGRIHAPPAVTAAADILGVVAIAIADGSNKRANRSHRGIRQQLLWVAVPVLGLGAVTALIADLFRSHSTPKTLLMEPPLWKGRPLPLLADVSAPDRAQLENGRVLLLVIDHNCTHCREFIAKIVENQSSSGIRQKVMIADVAAGPPDSRLASPFPHVHLASGTTYVGNLPFGLELVDGVVKRSF